MPRKTLEEVLHEVDPALKIARGRKRRATVTEFEAMAQPSVEERIRLTPAPRRLRRELDEWGNPEPPLVCSVCRRGVDELFPYGYMGRRFACRECIERRHRLLEKRGRLVRAKPARGVETREKLRTMAYYARQR